MIRYIYFDLGNVLLSFDHGKAKRQLAKLAGVQERLVHDLVFDGGLLEQLESGQLNDRQFHALFCKAAAGVEFSEFLTAYSDIFEPIPPMEQLVYGLHALHVPLGILSNTSAPHWKLICDGRYGLLPGPFRDCILSYEVGFMKPDRRIYEAAIDRAGCEPAKVFFCDDRDENVAGALAAGMDAVRFESPSQIADELKPRIEGFRV